jgi:hypothetical protein
VGEGRIIVAFRSCRIKDPPIESVGDRARRTAIGLGNPSIEIDLTVRKRSGGTGNGSHGAVWRRCAGTSSVAGNALLS